MHFSLNKIISRAKKQNIIMAISFIYLIIVIAIMMIKGMFITPDRLFIFLLFAALVMGRLKGFIKDWIPFILLILAYEMLRGIADNIEIPINLVNLVTWENGIFGFIPTEFLQQKFYYYNGSLNWYDFAATIIYFFHFPLPILVAFWFWTKNKNQYRKFVISLILLSFAGFITFVFFPAAPPWLAAKVGIISVQKIVIPVMDQLGWGWDFSYYYSRLNPNTVAAMPSLHAAYAWLAFLSLTTFYKKYWMLFIIYPILAWFSSVYLGEHYVIDLIMGVLYASVAYFIVYQFRTIKLLWFSFKKFKNHENLIKG